MTWVRPSIDLLAEPAGKPNLYTPKKEKRKWFKIHLFGCTDLFNLLTPNDPCMGPTAPLTSKRCILYIYSTNIGTKYFKHALYSPFFSLQNAVFFS